MVGRRPTMDHPLFKAYDAALRAALGGEAMDMHYVHRMANRCFTNHQDISDFIEDCQLAYNDVLRGGVEIGVPRALRHKADTEVEVAVRFMGPGSENNQDTTTNSSASWVDHYDDGASEPDGDERTRFVETQAL